MAWLEIRWSVRLPWWRRWPAIGLCVASLCQAAAARIIGGGVEVENR